MMAQNPRWVAFYRSQAFTANDGRGAAVRSAQSSRLRNQRAVRQSTRRNDGENWNDDPGSNNDADVRDMVRHMERWQLEGANKKKRKRPELGDDREPNAIRNPHYKTKSWLRDPRTVYSWNEFLKTWAIILGPAQLTDEWKKMVRAEEPPDVQISAEERSKIAARYDTMINKQSMRDVLLTRGRIGRV